jgi:hypothetical protein
MNREELMAWGHAHADIATDGVCTWWNTSCSPGGITLQYQPGNPIVLEISTDQMREALPDKPGHGCSFSVFVEIPTPRTASELSMLCDLLDIPIHSPQEATQ